MDALIDANDALFTVDLTHGQLEQIFYRTTALRQFDLQMTLPCSYDDYCAQRRHFVTPETLENYRIVDTASKLLERFHSGFKHVTVEYREQTSCGEPVWLQKTVLMAQDTVFDAASGREMPVIHGSSSSGIPPSSMHRSRPRISACKKLLKKPTRPAKPRPLS